MKNFELIIINSGEEEALIKGTDEEIIEYLKENESDLFGWMDEEARPTVEDLDALQDIVDVEALCEAVDHDWWTLEVR